MRKRAALCITTSSMLFALFLPPAAVSQTLSPAPSRDVRTRSLIAPAGTGGATNASNLNKFSFFVTSYAALQRISGSVNGFGGDLRMGETGPGAGLRGADKICNWIAEMSMPGASSKTWRAFLSVAAGQNGMPVNAIERIGSGPWYDRMGRLVANNPSELLHDRPMNADVSIKNNLPDESGNASQAHNFITGSNAQGRFYSAAATCSDWTSSAATNGQRPRVGYAWPVNCVQSPLCNWMSALDESGCAPGVKLMQSGPPGTDHTIGSGGGYGGFYCFALTP